MLYREMGVLNIFEYNRADLHGFEITGKYSHLISVSHVKSMWDISTNSKFEII